MTARGERERFPKSRRRSRRHLWLRLLAGLASFVLAAGAAATIVDEISANSGHTATATVTSVAHVYRGPDTITVRYTTSTGRTITTSIQDRGPEEGDKVQVLYAGSHPDRAKLKGSHGQLIAGLLFAYLAVVCGWAAVHPRIAFARRR